MLLGVAFVFASVQAAVAAGPPVIMTMGDSITAGVDYQTGTTGGYRDPLYRDLSAAGLPFTFTGVNVSSPTQTLTSAGEQQHNGFGGWHVVDLDANLDGVANPIGGGDSNNGGYLLTGGHGTGRSAVTPDILLLEIGTNDLLQGTQNLNQALYSLVTHFHALSPNTVILVAGITPINGGFTAALNAYNSYIKTQLVPSLAYTRFVDQTSSFLNADGSVNASLLGTDNVHPNRYGYPVLAQNWAAAIESLEGVNPAVHQLTVAGGTGSGAYSAGSVITLQANPAGTNQQFASWTAPTRALGNPYASPVVYTMPAADAAVTANYAVQGSPIVPNGSYEIASTFNGLAVATAGTSNGSAVLQQTFASSATQNWTLTNLGGNVVSLMLAGTNQALEVPASSASTLGAALDVAPYVGATNQQWLLTPNAGILELVNQSSGQAVNIAGYSTTPGSPLLQCSLTYVDEWWVFYPSSAPVATYTLTVNQGSGGGMYSAGTTAPVAANTAPAGMQFAGWTGGTSGLASPSAPSTTLIMPAANDTLTATYTTVAPTTYALTVNGGSGSGSYAAGTVVTVTAAAASSGSAFAGWTGSTSVLSSASSATTTLTMPSTSVAITATYAAQTSTGAGTNLGLFAVLNNGATQGNGITLPYGKSSEGGTLITYWGGQPLISVLAMSNSQYELVENVGNRCITVNGTAVTLAACSASPGQLMTLTAQGSGYTILAETDSCVQAPGAFSTLQAAACNGSAVQNWAFSGTTPLVLPSAPVTPPAAPAPVAPPAPAPVAPAPPASPGTTLGSWSLLNEVATQGNGLALSYGVSSEGGSLTTYWAAAKSGFNVVAMPNSQYELVENTALRCITINGSSATVATCTGASAQLFTLSPQSDGSYTLQAGSGQCLEAPGAFATVAALPCSSAASERWIFSGAAPLSVGTAAAATPASTASSTVPAGYHLTFDDEFATLNISDQNGAGTKWYTHTVQCCLYDTDNPSTPTYMAGITAPAGQDPYSLVAGGGLDVRLQKTNGAWYSGVLATVDSKGQGFAQQYGYFEMKAKFPAGLGTWPAFWLLNQNALTKGATAGEIDVVEGYMQFPTTVTTTLHDWAPPATTPGFKQATTANLSNGYHTFGMLWTATTMTFYCDGVTLYSMPTPSVMNQPYYPILDLGLGGGWPTAQTPQQSDMLVQYVRVYAARS